MTSSVLRNQSKTPWRNGYALFQGVSGSQLNYLTKAVGRAHSLSMKSTLIPNTDVSSAWQLVTPELAKHWLAKNLHNRSIRKSHLDRLVADMSEGLYLVTHQGAAFDRNDVLLDGQHRFQAIVESGIPQWMLVTFGLEPEAQTAMDGGAKRTASDFNEGPYAQERTAAARVVLALRKMQTKGLATFTASTLGIAMNGITTAEILNQVSPADDRLMRQHAMNARLAAKNLSSIGPGACLTAAVLYPDTADDFLNGLVAMAGLQEGDARLALLKFRGPVGRRLQTPAALMMVIKAARGFHDGRDMRVLKMASAQELTLDFWKPVESEAA